MEYYIDTDPGLGNGIPIEAADGSFDGTLFKKLQI